MTAGSLLQRWLDRLRGTDIAVAPPPAPAVTPGPGGTPTTLAIDERAALAAEYADELANAQSATDQVIERLPGVDFSPLARRSPSLAGYDWNSYVSCSL